MTSQPRYFTIQTIKGSGLGDQLGTQFSRLYGLGKALGATYIYSPISFHRSVKPWWYELSQTILFWIRCFFLFVVGQNIISNALNVILLKIERLFDNLKDKQFDTDLTSFLGLKYLNENVLNLNENVSICDIYIDDLIRKGKLKSIDNLNDYVTVLLNDKPESTVLRFCWTGKMWDLIPEIDSLLSHTEFEKDTIQQTIFSEGFWKQHKTINSKKINVVFHIRCGDSTTVNIGKRSIIVYDKFLFQSEDEMKDILKIDPERSSVLPEEYLDVYNEIVCYYENEKIDLKVISDGYNLTYQHVVRNLLKRKCSLRLNLIEKNNLLRKIISKNQIFNQFKSAQLIIGESKLNLQNSILALADADVVVWGCGGFACNTHNLFKMNNKQSVVMNVRNFNLKNIIKNYVL